MFRAGSGKWGAGSRKQEAGSQKPKAKSQKIIPLGASSQKIGRELGTHKKIVPGLEA
jgi:hypothetical protein